MGNIWRFIAILAGIVVTDWKKSNVALKLSNSNRRQITPAVIFCKLNTDLGSKQNANTAITTENIKNQSVKYAESAGSATDSTARANAAAAMEKGHGTITFSSATIFSTYGVQYVTRAGKMAFIHMFFAINSALGGNNVIATIPPGFRPYTDLGQVALANISSGSRGTVTLEASGTIRGSSSFATGIYLLDFSYPIA